MEGAGVEEALSALDCGSGDFRASVRVCGRQGGDIRAVASGGFGSCLGGGDWVLVCEEENGGEL